MLRWCCQRSQRQALLAIRLFRVTSTIWTETLQVLDAAGVPAAHVVFEHQQELSCAIIFAQVPLPSTTGVTSGAGRCRGRHCGCAHGKATFGGG